MLCCRFAFFASNLPKRASGRFVVRRSALARRLYGRDCGRPIADALVSHYLDPRMMAGRSGKTSVAGNQRSVKHFGEGNVHGVVGREIVPQIPDARQKEVMRISAQRKVSEVSESHATALDVDLAVRGIAANHLRNFDVE
jgi:hypothetical protein